jgi:hypothetical protein
VGIGFQKEIDNNPQSQLNPLFQYYLMRELKTDIKLTSNAAIGDQIINITADHGFTNGSIIAIWENNRLVQCEVIDVNTNAITLSMPLYVPFTFAANVIRGSINMGVDGTTPIDFIFKPRSSIIPIDISMAIISMVHSSEGDDGKFGGITALTNGLYFRRDGGFVQNQGNYKTNQDFKEYGFIVDYSEKAPSGTYATSITKKLIDTHTQELRFDPRRGDYFRAVVRDDLSTLTKVTMSLIGSYTSGE